MKPSRITFATSSSVRLASISPAIDGATKARAVRVGEAHAVLDVQAAIKRLHPIDLRQRHMLCFHYSEGTRRLHVGPDRHGNRLGITTSTQRYGIRHWWVCPVCKSRRRHLYSFQDVWDHRRRERSSVLACRTCLGLVYISQARHRCPDHDRRLASNGNADAQERVAARMRRDLKVRPLIIKE